MIHPWSSLKPTCLAGILSMVTLAAVPALGQEAVTFSAAQVENGQVIYREACQICHGNRLSNGQFGTPLRGSYFRNNWKGKSLGDLVQHTWEKMPPDNVQSMSWEQVNDVLAFILSRNDIEAGNTAMTTDREVLDATPLPW